MSASIKIGKIFGIPINLHITFLLILPLFAYLFSDPSRQTEILGIALSFKNLDAETLGEDATSFGTLAAIIFFMTILAHELAHSYLALRYGVKIKSITLMVFGGVSSMEEMPRQPGQEWRMAFAGPLSSLVIGGASYGAMLVLDLVSPGVRLTADGYIRPCLMNDGEVNVLAAMRKGEDLLPLIRQAVENKPKGHGLNDNIMPEGRCMAQIGG